MNEKTKIGGGLFFAQYRPLVKAIYVCKLNLIDIASVGLNSDFLVKQIMQSHTMNLQFIKIA